MQIPPQTVTKLGDSEITLAQHAAMCDDCGATYTSGRHRKYCRNKRPAKLPEEGKHAHHYLIASGQGATKAPACCIDCGHERVFAVAYISNWETPPRNGRRGRKGRAAHL